MSAGGVRCDICNDFVRIEKDIITYNDNSICIRCARYTVGDDDFLKRKIDSWITYGARTPICVAHIHAIYVKALDEKQTKTARNDLAHELADYVGGAKILVLYHVLEQLSDERITAIAKFMEGLDDVEFYKRLFMLIPTEQKE